ncbi:MAG: DegT/DnrJ/EryC1/StrS family aminotransferase [Polyangiaceae bacterium]
MTTLPPLPVASPTIGEREQHNVLEALQSGWVSSTGPYVEAFERRFASYIGVRHAVAVSNGTVALHLALHALGVGPGDEVIVPDLTFVATAHAVLMTGATPVFVDVDRATWCVSPAAVEKALSQRTKAILPVHLYGQPCDMTAIEAIARRADAFVIEDAAQGLGATWQGRRVGGMSKAGCFSFFGNKLITTGEGGMVVTNDDALAARLRSLHAHGLDPKRRYFHTELAFNYRMTNLQAALGLAQLEQIDEFLEAKRRVHGWYRERLGHLSIQLNPSSPDSAYWMSSVVLTTHIDRAHVMARLASRGVESRPFFVPMSQMPHLCGYRAVAADGESGCPSASELSVSGVNLPSGCHLIEADVERVCSALMELIRE